MDTTPQERFAALIRADSRYHPESYSFIFEALDYTVRLMTGEGDLEESDSLVNQHVTGPQLLEGVRQLALDNFGCLALSVFNSWGIYASADFGEIVFNLIEHGLMGRQESDSRDDFRDGWSARPIEDVFSVRPVFDYDAERDEWTATYESVATGSRS